MPRRPLVLIRRLIVEGTYALTEHAGEEAAKDELDQIDIESAVLTGEIAATQKGDSRGPKYLIRGLATDLTREVGVVLALRRRKACVIITVYEIAKA